MFEHLDSDAVAKLSDEALISEVTAAVQAEARDAAYRLMLVGEVTARQCVDEDDDSALQLIDGWVYAKAQVSAACNLGPMAAAKQMRVAMALRTRLPRTAEVFASGAVSTTVIEAITWRTRLVEDPDVLVLIDTAIAAEAAGFGTKSEKGLVDAVDLWVEKFDPDAVIRSDPVAKDTFVEFDDKDDPNGVASFWGRLRVTDKKILEQRLDALAATVCSGDPRPVRERRADALASLGMVGPQLERLACRCGDPECAGSVKDPRSAAVAIFVLSDQIPGADAGPGATPQPGPESGPAAGPDTPPGPGSEPPPDAAPESENEPEPDAEPGPASTPAAGPAPSPSPEPDSAFCPQLARPASPGVMLGGGIIPAAMLAELVATGAKVKPLAGVADLGTERQYRPSAVLTAFVRMRYLRCGFPGCNRPAHRCDLDHVEPWPAGPTHPGNLHPTCREHHVLKTHYGWAPVMEPDGTICWTAPTGHVYRKTPGTSMLFPDRSFDVPVPRKRNITLLDGDNRVAVLPKRRRTRAQERAHRVTAERARNRELRARREAESNSDPPY
ncbi:DUF222 domain-containing protein [Mycobacterium sp. C31M]